MANATNSVTLADYALMSNSPLIQKISYSLIQNGSVMADWPLSPYKSLIAHGARFLGSGLPTPAWRAINDTPTLTKGVPSPWQESAYILSNNIAIDRKLLEDKNSIQDQWSIQMGAYWKAVAYDINDKFINNNHTTGDKNAPAGLRWRLDNAADYGIPTEMKIDANVDISAGSNGLALLEQIQKLLDYMGSKDGTGIALYASSNTWRKVDRAVRNSGSSGGFEITKDQFDRRVQMYQNAKIVDIGRKADQTTYIITDTETTAGANGNSNYSSIYGVHYGEEYLKGWEFEPLEQSVTGPYLLTASGTQMQVTVDWAVGLWQEHIRAIGRLYDIKTS